MRTLLMTIVTLMVISYSGFAQNLITVENGSNVKFYTAIDSAIIHSADGDTLYVPGGSFDVSGITITKQLFIFGVGYNPDSTKATNFSYLSGDLTVAPGTKGGFLTGCALCKINLGTTSSYTITRCNIGTLIFTSSGGSSLATNNYFIENVIGKVDGGGSRNNNFSNNFIGILSNFSTGNTFNHNIISSSYKNCSGSGSTQHVADSVYFSTFENNIILGIWFSSKNCNVSNNLFVDDVGGGSFYSLSGGNIGSNNLQIGWLIDVAGNPYVFVKASNALLIDYSYSDDYHLISTCSGKNAATDSTDIGIYGGQFSWKDGAIPINPHIQQNIVSATTDANGNLKVNIKVEAQNH